MIVVQNKKRGRLKICLPPKKRSKRLIIYRVFKTKHVGNAATNIPILAPTIKGEKETNKTYHFHFHFHFHFHNGAAAAHSPVERRMDQVKGRIAFVFRVQTQTKHQAGRRKGTDRAEAGIRDEGRR